MAKQNISAEVLKTWIQNNPNRGVVKLPSLESKESHLESKSTGQTWETVAIEPATPLSCLLYMTDSIYAITPVSSRPSLLREKCTELEMNFASVLKGRQFPVRRTTDAIIAASTGGSNACSALGWKAMAELFQCQIVWFDESQKLIQFYPESVHEWCSENPIYFMSHLANQIWTPPDSWKSSQFADWLANKEHEGWRCNYEEAEGTMEELKALQKELDVHPAGKLLKADLQKRLGKARVIKHLSSWSQ
jgi:hypothetical protein